MPIDDGRLTIEPKRAPASFFAASGCVLRVLAVVLAGGLLAPIRSVAAARVLQDSRPAGPQAAAFIQGKLEIAKQGDPSVVTPAGAVAITSDNPSLLHTLQDSRLAGREVRLMGERDAGGVFEAEHLFTVRDGKLYRLRFYCHVCNIAATEPGPCVCCQRPTELEEIPADQVTDDMVMVP
ncbi:MAG TPA: hypothetical protein VL523_01215 [Terriglobia bacterium]|nr:hypothetical protein [Terriglobia bacterium]